MAYSTDILKNKCTILTRSEAVDGKFGRNSAGVTYTEGSTIWCSVTWTKGAKALREGALDAYDYIMVRCRYTSELTRECRVKVDGKVYDIQSFHADKQENTIQLTAIELTGNT